MLYWNGFREGLDPGFADHLDRLFGPLPYDYVVESGSRSFAVQDGLYAQGRTTPGAIVTNAKGGQSPHNYRVAADVYPVLPTGKPDYTPELAMSAMPAWRAMWNQVLADPELVSGKTFSVGGRPDYGHIELKNWRWLQQPGTVAEATGTPGYYTPVPDASPQGTPGEGGEAPTWDGSTSDAPFVPGSAGDTPAGTGWFEIDPVVAVVGLALLGIVIYAWRSRGR